MIFVATLKALTKQGEEALKRSVDAHMHKIVRQGLLKSGIKQNQVLLNEKPQVVVELRFTLSGLSKYALGNSSKGFEWWQEQFNDKLKNFDKAEEVQQNKDYTITWRKE